MWFQKFKIKKYKFFQNYILFLYICNFIINLDLKKLRMYIVVKNYLKYKITQKFFCFRFSLDIELGLFFLKSKKIYNLKLNNYKRRTTYQGKKLGFTRHIPNMADTLIKLLLKIINDEKRFLIFLTTVIAVNLLNISDTYPKDGTYYIYLANLVQNFSKLEKLMYFYREKIHTPQVGVVFLLSIFIS